MYIAYIPIETEHSELTLIKLFKKSYVCSLIMMLEFGNNSSHAIPACLHPEICNNVLSTLNHLKLWLWSSSEIKHLQISY